MVNARTRRPTALPMTGVRATCRGRSLHATPVADSDRRSGLAALWLDGAPAVPSLAVVLRGAFEP
jgi:hypothetical protein